MAEDKQGNAIAGLYPLTKLYMAIAGCVIVLLLPDMLSKAIWFLVICALAAASGVAGTYAKRMVSSVGLLFIILLLIQMFFGVGDTVIFTLGFLTAKWEGVLFAVQLGLNLACVAGSLIWLFTVTDERDLVLALEKKGLSPKGSYVVLSAFLMIPVLKKRSEVIMNAQRARGVETEGNLMVRAKAFVPMLVPLVLGSIAGTEERSLTLEARGFSVEGPRTHLHDISDRPIDKTVTIVTIAAVVAVVVGRVVLWVI